MRLRGVRELNDGHEGKKGRIKGQLTVELEDDAVSTLVEIAVYFARGHRGWTASGALEVQYVVNVGCRREAAVKDPSSAKMI